MTPRVASRKAATVNGDAAGRWRAPEGVAAATDPTRRVSTLGPDIPTPFFWLTDIACLWTAFLMAYVLTPRLKPLLMNGNGPMQAWVRLLAPEPLGSFRPLPEMLWVWITMSAVTLLGVLVLGGYRPLSQQSRTRVVMSAGVSSVLGLSAVALVLFTLRSPYWSRLFIYLFAAFSAIELAAYRLAVRWYRTKRVASGFYARHVVLIGNTSAIERLAAHILGRTSPSDCVLDGYMTLAPDYPDPMPVHDEDSTRLPYLGQPDSLGDLLVHRPVQEVIVVQGDAAGGWLRSVVDVCSYFRITLRIVPEALLLGDLGDLQLIYHSDPLGLPEVVLRAQHADSGALFVKRLMDIVIAAGLLVVLSPLFLLIALGIMLTTRDLPIFYRWRVVGYKGRPFTGYKFTTMVADADARQADLMHLNEMSGPVFKIKADPRVTPIGRFLRKYSLNELPQLWSVLKGDMSLVGPRPAYPNELARYELWHKRKLTVRPGITCLWQIRGRNRISSFDDWVRMDFEYIDNWSLWLDCRILIRTFWTVVAGTGS